jgi:hypothetical protein
MMIAASRRANKNHFGRCDEKVKQQSNKDAGYASLKLLKNFNCKYQDQNDQTKR